MDAAALRIKFAPLIKNIRTCESKCCVEIVPEVSGFRDLEKINWKIENDLIEYTIPMTYKIVIKKQEPVCYESDLDRTYHSCVELLPNHSLSNLGLGSGDVMRIFSDNVVYNKLLSKTMCTDEEIVETKPQQLITKAASNHDITPVPFANQAEELDKLLKEFEYLLQSRDGAFLYEDQIRKLENLIEAGDYDDETIKDMDPENFSPIITPKRNLSRYKLSLSPICSISTSENLSKGSKGSLSKTVDKVLHTTNCIFAVRGASKNVVLQAISTPSCASNSKIKSDSETKFNNASKFTVDNDNSSQVCSDKKTDIMVKNIADCDVTGYDSSTPSLKGQSKQDLYSDQKCLISNSPSEIRSETPRNRDLSDTEFDKDTLITDTLITDTFVEHVLSERSPDLDPRTISDHATNVICREEIGEHHTMKRMKCRQRSPEKFNKSKKRNYNKHSKIYCPLRTDLEQATHRVSVDGTFDDVMFKSNAENSSNNMKSERIKTNANAKYSAHYRSSPPTMPFSLDDIVPENNLTTIHEVRRNSPDRAINRDVPSDCSVSIKNDVINNNEPTISSCPYVTCVSKQISISPENFRIPERILPEIRVAKFVRSLEIEFFPLTVMLNDIHSKCASMGLFSKKQPQNSNVKRVSERLADSLSCDCTENNVNKCSSDNSTRSNRVVYTVMFKG